MKKQRKQVPQKSRINLNDPEIVKMVETIKTYIMADVGTTAVIRMALRKYIIEAERKLLK